jgi:hypothetical protein
MGEGLKFLIGAACCVVIAAGGYFAYGEYERKLDRDAAEQRAMRVYCERMIADLAKNETKGYTGGHISGCLNRRLVTQKDFRDAGAGAYLETIQILLDEDVKEESN